MGKHFRAERIFERFEHSSFQIKVPQVVIHKTDQPDVVMHFFNADGLSRKDLAEIDLFLPQADAPATRDHDGFVVEGILEIRQARIGTWGRVVDFCRTLHVQRFVRAFVVEDVEKGVKASLLLKEVGRGGGGGFFLQREVHAFMPAVLVGLAWLDAFDANTEA